MHAPSGGRSVRLRSRKRLDVTDDPDNATGSDDATGITVRAVAIPALGFAGMLALVLLITTAGALFLARRT